MKVGDAVWVMRHGTWREGVVSSAPEHGWVGVRGISGITGVVSVRTSQVSTVRPKATRLTTDNIVRVLDNAEKESRERPIDPKRHAMLVRERELLGRARTPTEDAELQQLQEAMPDGPMTAAVRKLLDS